MPSVSKAALLNLGVFLADNGLRRNVGSFAFNYPSPTASVNTNVFTLNPGQTFTWNTPASQSSLTAVMASGPLDVTVQLRSTATYALTACKLHIVDSDVSQLVITNPSLTDAFQLTIVQA